MNDEDKIRNLNPLQQIEGINIDNDRLILYVINLLEEMKIEPTFDKTVVAAFKLFPTRFSLIGFEEYPDGKRVHDCLFHCTYKPKNWLFGNAKSGYKITERGKYFLDETKKMLGGKIKVTKKYEVVAKRKELAFINLLKNTGAYKKYLEDKRKEISQEEIKEVLRVEMLTEKQIVKKNLDKYMDYANKIGDKNITDFLNFIKNHLKL
jgi:hypothetical protein